jgi:hypothetical protein
MENKKIIHATPLDYDGIHFRSKLEKGCYKILVEEGFKPEYENLKFTLQKAFKGTQPFYDRYKDRTLKRVVWGYSRYTVQDITYTPDFTFNHNGHLIVIECKGYENDVSPMKMKMFRYFMEKHPKKHIAFFEVYAQKDLRKAIEVIKNLETI